MPPSPRPPDACRSPRALPAPARSDARRAEWWWDAHDVLETRLIALEARAEQFEHRLHALARALERVLGALDALDARAAEAQ
jgi:hypothetical protein